MTNSVLPITSEYWAVGWQNSSILEESKMNIVRRAFAITFATGILLAGLTTMAQQRTYRGSYQSTRALLARIENRTNIFRNSLDAALDSSALDGTNAEDNINMFVQDFDSSVSRLRQ